MKTRLCLIICTVTMMLFLTIPVYAAVYTYDGANRISTVTFSNGKILTYTYNTLGNLVSVISNGVEPLNVVSTDPVNQDTDVPVGKVIQVLFDKKIQKGSNINSITVNQDETVIGYTYGISESSLSLIPDEPLAANTFYTVTVPSGAIQDSLGNTLENDLVFGFITDAGIPITGISLNKTSISILVNGSEKLVATVFPEDADNKEVTWLSSNEDIATVNTDGTVTGVSVGTTTITATTSYGNYTDICEVNVIEEELAEKISVTGISLNKTSVIASVYGTEALEVTITPEDADDQKVIWSSSNEEVATVSSSGVITAINIGTAIITATTNDGNFTVTCEVSVVSENEEPESSEIWEETPIP